MRHKERVDHGDWGYEMDVTLPCRDDLHELGPEERLEAFLDHQEGECPCGTEDRPEDPLTGNEGGA